MNLDAVQIIALEGKMPSVSDSAWIAPGATVIGDVELAPGASVWYGAVVRADFDSIAIGPGSNIQDNVSAHADVGFPVTLGAHVSVGHNAVLHGCTVGESCLIGMGAVVLNGAVIGSHCLVAAGAVVLGGTQIPPRSLVAGSPAKVRRELTDVEVGHLLQNAVIYQQLSLQHQRAGRPIP